jgi:hypothetical protein
MNIIASFFMSIAAFFGGLFGMQSATSTTTPTGNHIQTHTAAGMVSKQTLPPFGLSGKVVSISGTNLMVLGVGGKVGTATSTYLVDAQHATVLKKSHTTVAQFSDIKVGDPVRISGNLNGTIVIANRILDSITSRKVPGK